MLNVPIIYITCWNKGLRMMARDDWNLCSEYTSQFLWGRRTGKNCLISSWKFYFHSLRTTITTSTITTSLWVSYSGVMLLRRADPQLLQTSMVVTGQIRNCQLLSVLLNTDDSDIHNKWLQQDYCYSNQHLKINHFTIILVLTRQVSGIIWQRRLTLSREERHRCQKRTSSGQMLQRIPNKVLEIDTLYLEISLWVTSSDPRLSSFS